MNDPYLRYYANQAGSGVGTVYKGIGYQRGHGIGSFLGGLFRTASPIIKAVGKEALKSGIGLLGDVVYATPPREAFKNRAKEFTSGLKRRADSGIDKMMSGSGYKRRRQAVTSQSIAGHLTGRKRTTRRRPAKRSTTKRKAVRRKTTKRRTTKRKATRRTKRKAPARRSTKKSTKSRDIFG